jgi:hypothetical protein
MHTLRLSHNKIQVKGLGPVLKIDPGKKPTQLNGPMYKQYQHHIQEKGRYFNKQGKKLFCN